MRSTHGLVVRDDGCLQLKKQEAEVEGHGEELVPGVKITLVEIPSGIFLMGSLPGEEGRSVFTALSDDLKYGPAVDVATGDDQPWLIPAAGPNEIRLLRGGAWNRLPGRSRSASRGRDGPGSDGVYVGMLGYMVGSTGVRHCDIGLRVCYLPQDQLLDP